LENPELLPMVISGKTVRHPDVVLSFKLVRRSIQELMNHNKIDENTFFHIRKFLSDAQKEYEKILIEREQMPQT
jgi:hypothetical protein